MNTSLRSKLPLARALALAAANWLCAGASQAVTVHATLPDFSGSFPVPDTEVIGTFSFAAVDVADITKIVISGAWGDASQVWYGSANSTIYANGIAVANCSSGDICWGSGAGPIAWSYDVSASDYASIASGTVQLTASFGPDGSFHYGQNVLSNLQLDINPLPVPEPQTYALMLLGLAAVGVAAKRRAH